MNRRQGRVLRGTPLVAVVQTADLWNGDHTASRRRRDWTGKGCILVSIGILCMANSKIGQHSLGGSRSCWDRPVRDLAVLFLHLLATVARLAGPGGARSVVAESVLVKHQLLILNRSRKRSPNLRPSDRVVAGVCALLMRPGR